MLLDENIRENREIIDCYEEKVNQNNQEVTVFVLTHNRSNYLGEMIKSVLGQTYTNYQLIVLNDVANDDTERMVSAFGDDRLIYIEITCDLVCDKLYFANEICKTEYLIILHDDDIVEPSYLDEIIDQIRNSDCVAVSCAYRQIDENGKPKSLNLSQYTGELNLYRDYDYLTSYLSNGSKMMNFPSTVYKTSFYQKFYQELRPFNYSVIGPCFDQWIWFESCRRGGAIGYYDRPLYNYRVHSGQDGGIKAGKMEMQFINFLLSDETYSNVISEHRISVCERVLLVFKILTKKYYQGEISDEWYKDQFHTLAYKSLMKNFKGWVYAMMIQMAFLYGRIKKSL